MFAVVISSSNASCYHMMICIKLVNNSATAGLHGKPLSAEPCSGVNKEDGSIVREVHHFCLCMRNFVLCTWIWLRYAHVATDPGVTVFTRVRASCLFCGPR